MLEIHYYSDYYRHARVGGRAYIGKKMLFGSWIPDKSIRG